MKKYYLIDHKILFLFGFVFYLIIPYVVGVTEIFNDFDGMELYYQFFRLIPQNKLDIYLVLALSWIPAFYLGHFCFSLITPYKRTLTKFPPSFTSQAVSYVGILLFIALIIFSFMGRDLILGGYGRYELSVRGKMNTLVVIFNFFFLYQLLSDHKVSPILIIGTLLTALVSLSMGGRTYVIQTFVVYLIYKTSFAEKRWKIYQIALVAVVGFFVGSFVGLWRIGSSFDLQSASYSVIAEPVFTWFSTSTFLALNEIPMFNFPSNFLTSFINLIPNTFFNFESYVISTKQMGFTYANPLGADSLWTTCMINFGYIGSFIFIFVTGFMLNYLRHLSEESRFWGVYYILTCGILPFEFFRDGFFILNKQLFFNFLAFPVFLLALLKLGQYVKLTKGSSAKKLPVHP